MDSGSKSSQTSIMHIPDEHLYLVFEKLDTNFDKQSFGLSCHRFLDIENSSRKCLGIGCLPVSRRCPDTCKHLTSSMLDRLLNRFRQLELLCLSKCIKVSDSGLTKLQIYGSKLHTLYLDECNGITRTGFSYVASGCPSLAVVSLSQCYIGDDELEIITKSCKSLKEVNLSFCPNITDLGILSLNQNCRQLRALKISWCAQISGVNFLGCSPTLAFLEADDCAIQSKCFTGILSGAGLEYLSLACPREAIEGLATIGLGFARNLKILNFWKCSFVTDDVVISISKGCPMLQEWNLSGCVKITISGWHSIGSECHNLERLHAFRCPELCDSGLLYLGNGCKRLSVLYVSSYYSSVTSSGLQYFKTIREDVEIIAAGMKQVTPVWAFTT